MVFTAFGYIAQAQVNQTAACTSGNLATVAASYLSTVTNLTVTGTIDARDFKTMRTYMPQLSVIDLSDCTVEAYTGTAGTRGDMLTVYPANEIPEYSFRGKVVLQTIIFPSVTSIGIYAFESCIGLTSILTMPATVTTIGDFAFSYCTALTGALAIAPSVTTIGKYAFMGCNGLTGSLIIPPSVIFIGSGAFSDCSGFIEVDAANPNYSSQDGVLFNKDKTTLIKCPSFKTGSYAIPPTVTVISEFAFSGCKALTGSLVIPSSVKTIGPWAFYECSGFNGTITIPESVTTIGDWAFYKCYRLKGPLVLPTTLTTIGHGVFYECSSLNSLLTIPASVTTIGNYAFYYCSGFTGSLTIPPSVTSIGTYAFSGCFYLTGSLTIPPSVTAIGKEAFRYCEGFKTIYASSSTPIDISASSNVFEMINKSTCILHVPVGSKALYEAADQWQDFSNIVEDIPASIDEALSSSITIFPNPATSYVTVSGLGSIVNDKTVTILVTNVSGSTLLVKDVESNISNLTLDVSSYKSGIYFIAIQTSNGSVVKRFVKE
jgi:hypothetical protein